jgi:macrodomain Ter protein organizer (MatP/YcbG family)
VKKKEVSGDPPDQVVKKSIFIKVSVWEKLSVAAKEEQRPTMHHAGVVIERMISGVRHGK